MSLPQYLKERSGGACELCHSENGILVYEIPFSEKANDDAELVLCAECNIAVEQPENTDLMHMRCLLDSMWNTVPAVQVMSYRMLKSLSNEAWARDAVDQIYLDEDIKPWATAIDDLDLGGPIIHKDCNNNILVAGDSVILIKDLDVKGANFIAKKGAVVRNIRLVEDNAEQIEGKVNDQHIVILTKFVKKA